MSDKDSEQPLDLSSLQLAPDWVSSLDSGSTPNYKELENVDYTERKGGKGRGKGGGQGRNRPGGGGDRRGQGGGGDRRGQGGGGDRRGQGGGGDRRGQGGGGDRRGQGGGGDRRGQGGGGDRRGQGGGGDRRGQGGDRGAGRGRDQRGGDRRGGGRFGNRDRQPLETPPGLSAKLVPNAAGIKALAQTIKRSGRTFGLIDIAKLIVGGRERYDIAISPSAKQKPDTPAPKLTRCKTDGSLWLSREEAMRHVIDSGIIEQNYGVEQVQVDPPKGNFSGIAVCGMSGTLLGPPNHHSYLENVLKLHRERFSTWNLERYKSRIRVETGEEIVEKWKTEQSTRTEWVFPKPAAAPDPEPAAEAEAAPPAEESPAESAAEEPTTEAPAEAAAEPATDTPAESPTEATAEPASDSPTEAPAETAEQPVSDTPTEAPAETTEEPASDTPEPLRFTKRADLERHARETFAEAALEELDSATIPGNIPGKLLSPLLLNLVKSIGEHSRRSPAILIAPLCDLLGEHGLKFFRWGGKQLFTSHTRPRQLNSDTPMGAEIRAIFDFVRANPNSKPQDLLDQFAPVPKPQPTTPPEAAAAEPAAQPQPTAAIPAPETTPADPAAAGTPEGAAPAADTAPAEQDAPAEATAEQAAAAEEPAAGTPAPAPQAPSLTPQQISVLQHLRWLVGEGYIIEFADGRLDAVRVRTITPESKEKPAEAKPAEAKSAEPAKKSSPPAETTKPTEPAPAAAAPTTPVTPAPDPVSEHAPDPGLTPQTDPDLSNDPGLPADLEP